MVKQLCYDNSYVRMVYSTEPEFVKSLGIDSKESIPPAYVAWRAGSGTSNRAVVPARQARNLVVGSLNLQNRAQRWNSRTIYGGARNQVGTELTNRPASECSLFLIGS